MDHHFSLGTTPPQDISRVPIVHRIQSDIQLCTKKFQQHIIYQVSSHRTLTARLGLGSIHTTERWEAAASVIKRPVHNSRNGRRGRVLAPSDNYRYLYKIINTPAAQQITPFSPGATVAILENYFFESNFGIRPVCRCAHVVTPMQRQAGGFVQRT